MSKASTLREEKNQSRLIPGRAGLYAVAGKNRGVAQQDPKPAQVWSSCSAQWMPPAAANLILPIGAVQRRQWRLPFQVVYDVLLIVAGFTLAQSLVLLPLVPKSAGWGRAVACLWLALGGKHFGLALIFGALVTLLAYSDGSYRERHPHARAEYFPLFKAVIWASLLVAVAFRWSAAGLGREASLALGAPASLLVLCLSRFSAYRLRQRPWQAQDSIRNVLIVGANRTGRALADYLESDPQSLRRVKGLLDDNLNYPRVLGRLADLSRVARAEFVDEVIVALPHDAERTQRVLADALHNQLDVKIVPEAWKFVADRTHLEEVGPFPLLKVHEEPIPILGLAFKRTLDVVAAGILLLLLSPLLAVLATAIKLDSRGPVLYSAPRVGRKGRRFRCHKFRTMVADADQRKEQLRQANERQGPTFKVAGDPRITRAGGFLRRYSLDELPQLWNVLKGDMSLVGPRPHPLDDFARYDLEHLRRLDVTPGLTGLWQVSARRDPSFQKNMVLDLEYIENWSLLMDLRILLRTVGVVLAGSGSLKLYMQAQAWLPERRGSEVGAAALAALLRPMHAMLAAPGLMFIGTLAVFLFRPPDLELHHLDRIAFLLLCAVVILRVAATRERVWPVSRLIWPMLALLGFTAGNVLSQPFNAQTWSMVAAKFVVPYAMFLMAGIVFNSPRALRHFEIFCLIVLGYLAFVSIAFLAGMHDLIFPRYILNPDLGIHLDRARGPFLQAVANGLALTLLGLVAFDAVRARRVGRWAAALLLVALPAAILATMTRAVWIAFIAVLFILAVQSKGTLRNAAIGMAGLTLALAAIGVCLPGFSAALEERAEERGPVEVRMAVQRAAWEMVAERPLAGWGANQMPAEVASRMEDYHLDAYWAHNTYLEILVEQGIVGLALYLWILAGFFRMSSSDGVEEEMEATLLNAGFRRIWLLILAVYVFNGFFVVLNYQFVNALVFSIAGMLAAQDRRLEMAQ